jgi:hypothetical protein
MADKATRPLDRQCSVPTGNVLPNTRLSSSSVGLDVHQRKSSKVAIDIPDLGIVVRPEHNSCPSPHCSVTSRWCSS